MSAHDTLNSLAHELRALPRRQQRQILSALTPSERARMATLLSPPEVRPEPLELRAPADPMARDYSSFIVERLETARDGSASGSRPWRMTPTAGRQLLAAAEELQPQQGQEEGPTAPSHPSLLGTFARMVTGDRSR